MAISKYLKKNSLKTRDDERTRGAELTLRQSIYPIALVTILFFLWVSFTTLRLKSGNLSDELTGLLLRTT